MANTTSTCSSCGNADRDGALIPVIDETGGTAICGLCVIAKLPRWVLSGDVTLVVARPTAVAP
jgi:hypothetical protein